MTSVLWMDLTAEELRAKAATDTIVVLPVASIEQHGPHLPVGVDTILLIQIKDAANEREEMCFVAFEGLSNGLQPPADTMGERLHQIIRRIRENWRHVAPRALQEFFL